MSEQSDDLGKLSSLLKRYDEHAKKPKIKLRPRNINQIQEDNGGSNSSDDQEEQNNSSQSELESQEEDSVVQPVEERQIPDYSEVANPKLLDVREDSRRKEEISSENTDRSNQAYDDESVFSNLDLPDELPAWTSNVNLVDQQKTNQTVEMVNHVGGRQEDSDEMINQMIESVGSQREKQVPSGGLKVKQKKIVGAGNHGGRLSVVTFNVWYGKKDQQERLRRLCRVLVRSGGRNRLPDLICLQEVTPQTYRMIEKVFQRDYFLFEIFSSGEKIPHCAVTCINRKAFEIIEDSLTAYHFESQMGRKVLACQLKHKGSGVEFHLFNAHLESRPRNHNYREVQVESVLSLVRENKIKNLLFVGDLNLSVLGEPAELLLREAELTDAWMEIGSPGSLKYTYDTQENSYARDKLGEDKSEELRRRLDRVLYRFDHEKVNSVVTKIRMLGIEEEASDHYGLLVEMALKKVERRI